MRVLLVGLVLLLSTDSGVAQPPKAPQAAPPGDRPPVDPAKAPFRLGPADAVPQDEIRNLPPDAPPPILQFRGARAVPQRSRAPILSDLVLAKIDQAGRVIMMVESYRTEKKKVQVTMFKREKRQREVVVDGKTVTQDYTVNVPVTEEREVDVNVPAGKKPVTLQPKEVRFFNLKCEAVTIDEVAKNYTSLSPIFLIDQNTSDPLPITEVAMTAIKEKCYIAVTEKRLRASRTPPLAPFALPAAPVLPPVQLRPAFQKQD